MSEKTEDLGRRVVVTPVEPIGTRRTGCFVSPGGYQVLDLPQYPSSPRSKDLRRAREALGITLRRAADILGISVVELSGLELGSHTADDWDAIIAALEAAP